jgi:GrpB-like predicted nucleotidyltransferase (UPF0157 family)
MDEIEIAPYDLEWPALAAQEIAKVRAALPSGLVRVIEHIGSTAVPGLAAKPIVDLMILTRALTAAKQLAVPPLEAMGYSYWRANPNPARMFLVKGLPPAARRTHHIHITEDEAELTRHCGFRDHLRRHAEDAKRYEALKRALASLHRTDREAYTEAKNDFVREIEAKLHRGRI